MGQGMRQGMRQGMARGMTNIKKQLSSLYVTSDKPKENRLYKIKMILIGDQDVGKSSLAASYVKQKTIVSQESTVGMGFLARKMYNMGSNKDKDVSLQIWDSAGQERFRSIVSSYFQGVNIAFLVFDITRRSSFASIKSWYDDVIENSRGDNDILFVLVGNKIDLSDAAQIAPSECRDLARQLQCEYVELSCFQDIDVITSVFERSVNHYIDDMAVVEDIDRPEEIIIVSDRGRSKCCNYIH